MIWDKIRFVCLDLLACFCVWISMSECVYLCVYGCVLMSIMCLNVYYVSECILCLYQNVYILYVNVYMCVWMCMDVSYCVCQCQFCMSLSVCLYLCLFLWLHLVLSTCTCMSVYILFHLQYSSCILIINKVKLLLSYVPFRSAIWIMARSTILINVVNETLKILQGVQQGSTHPRIKGRFSYGPSRVLICGSKKLE